MRRNILFLLLFSVAQFCAAESLDSLKMKMDSMDKTYEKLKGQSEDLKTKIDEAGKKIDAVKEEKSVNYWIPIGGGALLGIALAWWLKRRKAK